MCEIYVGVRDGKLTYPAVYYKSDDSTKNWLLVNFQEGTSNPVKEYTLLLAFSHIVLYFIFNSLSIMWVDSKQTKKSPVLPFPWRDIYPLSK